MKEFDTICAIATALGEGGIAIIRISGDKALDIASKIFRPKSNDDIKNMKPYTMKYGHIYDIETDELIDEVIISFMKGPRSFTAEDTIEINCHGGVVSTNKVLEAAIKAGARLAEPGEFTKRAFLNGRIDLSQAEAVMDIITAKTDLAMKSALMQSTGYLSREINRLREFCKTIELYKYNGKYVTNIHQIGSRKKRPNITDQFLRLDNNSDKLLPFCFDKSILHSG